MEVNEAIANYLFEYGNTKRADLVSYIKEQFGYSDKQIRKILHKLETQGKIFRVVHDKLKPPAIYYSLKEHMPLEIQKELLRSATELKKAELDYYARVESARV